MIENKFIITTMPSDALAVGTYNLNLVTISYIIAVFASYVALDMIGRLRSATDSRAYKRMWLFGGAFAMGSGIWAVHFIGMLAYSMAMPMSYDLKITILSMVPAFIGSYLALLCLRHRGFSWKNLLLSAIFLGGAVISMHYTEMEAMLGVEVRYKLVPFTISIFVAMFLSGVALWLALMSNIVQVKHKVFIKIGSAFTMAAAICSVHYTGLPGAAVFTPLPNMNMQGSPEQIDPIALSMSIAMITIAIMGIAIAVSTYQHLMSSKLKILYDELAVNSEKLQNLLQATLPKPIINELIATNFVEPRLYKNVATIFTDISEFTRYCSQHTPKEVYSEMQDFVGLCETISNDYGLEKIKTIGDAFMAVSGMFIKTENPVLDAVQFSLTLLQKKKLLRTVWEIHIGIDYGDVMAGIVGNAKYLFDAWGDCVNTAARIQDIARPDTIYISKSAWEMVKDKCNGRSLGLIDLKGKGSIEIYEVTGLKG